MSIIKELESRREGKTRMSITLSPLYFNVAKKVCSLYNLAISNVVEKLLLEFLSEELFDLKVEEIKKLKLNEEESVFVKEEIKFRTCQECWKEKTTGRYVPICEKCKKRQMEEFLKLNREVKEIKNKD